MLDEVYLLDRALIVDHRLARVKDLTVHSNDELVGESSLTFIENMLKMVFKLLEGLGVLHQLSLHVWG